jgi:hypothetical protein
MPSCIRLASASVHRSRALGVQFHRYQTDDTNSSAFRLAIPGTDYHLPTNRLRSRSDRKKKCNGPPFIRAPPISNRNGFTISFHHFLCSGSLSSDQYLRKVLDLGGTNQILRISVEEKALRENLGPEYVRYSERTEPLIPGKFRRGLLRSHTLIGRLDRSSHLIDW